MSYRFELMNLEETIALATLVAELSQPQDVITLKGPLGVGKSEFARAFIRSLLGFETDVPSPTYTLVQTYDGDNTTLWHFDLYRLEAPEEVWELGLEEALLDGISLIEWPERLGKVSFKNHLEISIEMDSKGQRRIFTLIPDMEWQDRLDTLDDD
jgi:tRNA threonylcarbamoyladenosine biosynthesis protein TsaE